MTTTGEVLKPCPFCGEAPKLISHPDEQFDMEHYVWCNHCGTTGSVSGYSEEAVSRWNRRAPQGNAAQEGYVLVPVEPTKEMRYAGSNEMHGNRASSYRSIYKAMIAAAPSNKEVER